MSRKYKFTDQDKLYFVSFAVINWIDLIIRRKYKDIIVSSLVYCQKEKGLELFGWCIKTSHIHLFIGTSGNPMQNILRDLKRHTSETLHNAIRHNGTESRREWLLWIACIPSSSLEKNPASPMKNSHSSPILLVINQRSA